jgi:hypothetical protein
MYIHPFLPVEHAFLLAGRLDAEAGRREWRISALVK